MKKLLLIALLIVGCDYAPTEHTHDGICVKRVEEGLLSHVYYTCYSTWTEKDCMSYGSIYEWYTRSCDEFCAIESTLGEVMMACDISE